jgi:hypothetical protein
MGDEITRAVNYVLKTGRAVTCDKENTRISVLAKKNTLRNRKQAVR